jgi:hypothetical protein
MCSLLSVTRMTVLRVSVHTTVVVWVFAMMMAMGVTPIAIGTGFWLKRRVIFGDHQMHGTQHVGQYGVGLNL